VPRGEPFYLFLHLSLPPRLLDLGHPLALAHGEGVCGRGQAEADLCCQADDDGEERAEDESRQGGPQPPIGTDRPTGQGGEAPAEVDSADDGAQAPAREAGGGGGDWHREEGGGRGGGPGGASERRATAPKGRG